MYQFKVVSTGKRVSSLYAEPELSIYPLTNRMRLTKKALELIGVAESDRVQVLGDNKLLAFVKDDEGKCKVDKNGNFTSSAVVTPLEIDSNTSYKKFEVMTCEAIGLGEDFGDETPVIVFDLSDGEDAEDIEDTEKGEDAEDTE